MRLIDADALRESYRESIEECHKWADEMRKSGNEEMVIRAEQSLGTFVECSLRAKNAPTIDSVPVKHGVWRKIKYRSICRDCSFRGFASWNYCPNCGRQMTTEGERNDDVEQSD